MALLLVALLFCSSFGQPTLSQWTTDQLGDGTYYGGNLQGGHCSIYPLPNFVASNPAIVPVAMNSADYAGSFGCGQCVEIRGTGSGAGANPIPTTPFIGFINDECPGCPDNLIDLGKSGDGKWGIKWRGVDCPVGNDKLSYAFQGSNPWYIKVQVRGHKIPVQGIQFQSAGGSTFYPGVRQPDNFFTCPTCPQMTAPIKVRVTGLNGQVLEDFIPTLVQGGGTQPAVAGTSNVQFNGIGSASTPPPPPTTGATPPPPPPTTGAAPPPTTGAAAQDPICTSLTRANNQIPASGSFSVTVGYQAFAAGTLLTVDTLNANTYAGYGSTTVTVGAGTSSTSVTITLIGTIPSGVPLKIKAWLVPASQSGNWAYSQGKSSERFIDVTLSSSTPPPTTGATPPPTTGVPPPTAPTAPVAPPPPSICPSSFKTTNAGSSLTRFDQFIATLTTMEGGNAYRAVHSSGGAAGGVVTEGQGYGLFIGGATAAALGSSNADFNRVVTRTYEMFLGWQQMCFQSTSDGCQSPRYCVNNAGGAVPCLPHWKFNDQITSAQGTGSAPDGDEDAILGMILLLKATQSNKPTWWNTVAEWTYRSSKQFYESSTAPQGAYRIVKLGSCWGGWDCNNPSYHAPAAYKQMRDWMAFWNPAEGATYVSKWNTVIDTSYAVLLAGQCSTTGLNTNWYVPNSNPAVQGTTGCSGSGTPAAEFGSEASRTMWRVVLDYIWTGDSRAATFLGKAAPHIAQRFSANQNLATGCLVQSIHSGWLDNAFMYGPCLSTLVYPGSGITQAIVNSAGSKLASGSVNDYYSGSWVVISTLVLNGDLARIGCTGSPTPVAPPTTGTPPVAPPTRPPTTPPVAPPTRPPVAPPTRPPVAPPTTPPVAPPTRPPVAPPTRPPTTPPVAPPTRPPVAPPTRPPVAPPTRPPPPPVAPPTRPPTTPPTAPPTSSSCNGVMYGDNPSNNWWVVVKGIPQAGRTVKVECATPSTKVTPACAWANWGDRWNCQLKDASGTNNAECLNNRVAIITYNGVTTRCPLNAAVWSTARMDEEETDSQGSSFPGYGIGLIVVGAVLLGLVVVAFVVIFKMKPATERV